MKATYIFLAPVILLASCAPNQIPFAGSTANSSTNPVAPAANINNQFGVPGVNANIPTAPSYQPIDPINPIATPSIPSVPSISAPPTTITNPADSALNGNVHTIAKGDNLWSLARKYGTTVSALKSLNGLSTDTIITGSTLIIPGR